MAEYPARGISEEELVTELEGLVHNLSRMRISNSVYDDTPDCLHEAGKSKGVSEEAARAIADNLGEYCRGRSIEIMECEKIDYLLGLHDRYFPDSKLEKLAYIKRQIAEVQKINKSLEDSIIRNYGVMAFTILSCAKGKKP